VQHIGEAGTHILGSASVTAWQQLRKREIAAKLVQAERKVRINIDIMKVQPLFGMIDSVVHSEAILKFEWQGVF
jgi:hypothetical protein